MPNIVYTVPERVEMVRQHEQGLSYGRIRDHFAATYPDRPIPSKSTVGKIVKKFCETGNLDPSLIKITYPNKQLTEETKLNICLTVEEGLKKPLSKIAEELNVSKASVQKVIKSHKHKHKYKPYDLNNRKKTRPPVTENNENNVNNEDNLNHNNDNNENNDNNDNNMASDVSPLHYSLWSYLKNKLYSANRIEDLNPLWNRVNAVLEELDPQIISNINCALDIEPEDTKDVLFISCGENSGEGS